MAEAVKPAQRKRTKAKKAKASTQNVKEVSGEDVPETGIQTEEPLQNTIEVLPKEEETSCLGTTVLSEPEEPLQNTTEVLPKEEEETSCLGTTILSEPEEPLQNTTEVLPKEEETSCLGTTVLSEPEEPLQNTTEVLPKEEETSCLGTTILSEPEENKNPELVQEKKDDSSQALNETSTISKERQDLTQETSEVLNHLLLKDNETTNILQQQSQNEAVHLTDDQHSVIRRPQTLPTFNSLSESLKAMPVIDSSESAQNFQSQNPVPADAVILQSATVSLASHMQQHHSSHLHHQHILEQMSNPQRQVIGLPFPHSVIEDPNTPMSRATSPPATKVIKSEIKIASPALPTIVQEEKSPTLLAQEALARSQVLTFGTTVLAPLPHMKEEVPTQAVSSQVETQVKVEPKSEQRTGEKKSKEAESVKFHSETVAGSKTKTETLTSVKTRIYPELQTEQTVVKTKARIGAMTLSELLALYYNPQLAYNEIFIDEFVQKENKRENHEFAEILNNYFRARHQLLGVEEDIRLLQRNYSTLQKELWITYVRSVSVQGQCMDQVRVSMTHKYEQCELNTDTLSQMSTTLERIRTQIAENLSLFAYSAQISKLQVESYIHDLYMACSALRNIPKNAGVQGRQQVLTDESHQIQRLKDCITILFMFHRKPTNDTEFINSIRQWTIRLTSSLLRLATFSDHLFILNHLLRCPAGVGKWGAELIQCPSLPSIPSQHQSNFGSPLLDHIITVMATVLLPTKAREEFMCQMRINLSEQSMQDERAWILVDSDGEEDEDPTNAWLYLHENDIVAFLGQFPLTEVFVHILLASISETGIVDYDIRRSTEPMMIRLFAFATMLIQLLGAGLATYSMARYRQLNKRLGRLVRQTVSFVSDHWLNFKTYYGPLAPAASIEGLQMEFDQLFLRATYSILIAQKLGSWQFMAGMPYTCVSKDSMWQLLWILHQGQGQVVNLDQMPSAETCKEYLQNPDSWHQLADNLMNMPISEALYLLTAFANMAGCRSFEEQDFIQTITLEIFEIAYICNHTREFCSKDGRELLSSVIQTHPSALSFLLAKVKEVMTRLGTMAIYLFSELPVCIWQPTDPDMLILRQWLLNHDLSSAENQLARSILANINWGVFEQTGRLVVDIRLHRQVALLLVEAYTKFISDKKAGFFIMEGMKQMASYMTSTQNAEQVFNNWAWDLTLRLKLHQQSVVLHASGTLDVTFEPPMLGKDTWLVPLMKGTSNKTPIACFVALAMTHIGHEITNFISEGLDLLAVLTASSQYTTAIHCLGCVVPIFLDCQQYLLENVTFCQILTSLLAADESLFKSTKSAIMNVEFPGIVAQQLTEMIQAQVTSHLTHGKADKVITFWLKAIFKVCRFFTDRNSCYIADILIRWSFVKKGVLDLISQIFKEQYMQFCAAAKSRQNFVTSVFHWMASSNTLPSYMDSLSLPEFPWLAYMILFVEGEMEVNTRLWQTLISELHSTARPNIETALKSAIGKLQLEQAPSSNRLNIYRWAQQALDTPYDHPLLPILWQRFFALYLGRQVFESSIAQRASVGERFFESMFYSNMLKKMRKCLSETSTYHMNFDPQKMESAKRRKSSHSPGTPPGGGDPTMDFEAAAAGGVAAEEDLLEYTSSKEFHQMLARLYQTYSLWLEEPRLHDGNLYLPALPPQYEAMRLNQVFQGFMGPWLEFVDLEGVQYTLSCLAADWRKRLTCLKTAAAHTAVRRNTQMEPENATERIIRRLGRFGIPKSPPVVQSIQSPVPLISSAIVEDKDSLIRLIDADLDVLTHHTKIFSARMAHHCALNSTYTELIPNLYSNESQTITLTAECRSKVNPLHQCTGAAVMPVKLEIKQLKELTQRRLDENRVEYKQVMIESLLPTATNICVATVHTENAITLLIKQSQKSTDELRVKRMNEISCTLFFYMAELVCSETDFYPPTKLFFASCIEILGQEFVCRDPSQTQLVLQLCLDKPSVAGLVSPHFTPNNCPALLVSMYGQLLHVLQTESMDLVFMLLTKFDIGKWLQTQCPCEDERKRFVETLGSAMMACGAELKAESKMVYGLHMSHLKAVLESNFPSNLNLVINIILQGSASERLHTQVWETLLRTCFIDQNVSSAMASAGKERADSMFDRSDIEECVDCRLSTAQVKQLLEWMSSFFMYSRLADPEIATFGLYSRWGRYVPYVSLLIGALARSLITKVINGSDEISSYEIMEHLWQPLIAVFAPWIQPYHNPDGTLTAPWVEADDVLAIEMVASFRQAVLWLYQQMKNKHPSAASGIFSGLLMYYMTYLCTKSTTTHLMGVYVSELKRLPWGQLQPDLQLLQVMMKVKEVSSPCCFSLIGHIVPHIQWQSVMDFFKTQNRPDITCLIQAGLGILLIQTHVDKDFGQDDEVCHLLSEAQTFDWSLLTSEAFSCVCNWFLQLADAKCVLAERSSKLALGIRLLKQMSGFQPDIQWNETLTQKRLTYIHCLTQQLCQLTYTAGVSQDSVKTVIVNLLSEIEAVESSVSVVECQEEESVVILKDVLSLLNNSNPEGSWLPMIMSDLTSWLRSSPQTLLLIPCMKAASRCLASLRQMAVVMETTIEVYFSGLDLSSPSPKGWPFIISAFQVPELNQAGYVQDSLSENAFLVLYAYLQHKLPSCQGLGDELRIMEEILDWTVKAQPSAEDEAKLVLWWHLLLRLTVRQVQYEAFPFTGSINILSRFISHLTQMGQERSGKGLLGAFGLGRKAPHSNKLRLLARALCAFLGAQIINSDTFRVNPTSRLGPGPSLGDLRTLRKTKSFVQLSQTIDHAIGFIQDTNHTIYDGVTFLGQIVQHLYADKQYLCDVISQGNVQH